MVHLESNDRVDFMHYLLISVLVQLAIIEGNDNFRIISIHCFIYRGINRKIQHLDVSVQLHKPVEFLSELCLSSDIVLWTPLVDLAQTHLVDCLLDPLLRRFHTLLLILLHGLPDNEADFGQYKRQLQFVMFKQDEHVSNFIPIESLTA